MVDLATWAEPMTLRERAAALCDAAAARWRVLAPGESVTSEARRERAGAAMVVQDCAQDTADLARLHALVRCEPEACNLHDHTACVAAEFARLRAGGGG